MNDRELMQMALEALESVFEGDDKGAEYWTVNGGTYEAVECMNAMRALRAALAQPEPEELGEAIPADEEQLKRIAKLVEPEPVAWLYTNKFGGRQVSLIDPPTDMKEQYQPLYTIPPQANDFNPDWDAIPVMVEEQQRMAKRIEELEAQLGEAMWGYGEWRRKAEISSALCTRQGIRLMEYESQEPVACVGPWHDGKLTLIPRYSHQTFERDQPLYTAPPQREWQGLTDEEKSQVALSCGAMTADWLEFARAIEAKLKEKNG